MMKNGEKWDGPLSPFSFMERVAKIAVRNKVSYRYLMWISVTHLKNLERVARIELARPGRKHGILPLNYTRN